MLWNHIFSAKTCKEVRRNLSAYLDSMLEDCLQQRIEVHLRWCEACTSELEALRKTIAALHEFSTDYFPEALKNYRIPRSTFIDVFPSIREEKPTLTYGYVIPYLSAAVIFFVVLTAMISLERMLDDQYNPSNYVEVFADPI